MVTVAIAVTKRWCGNGGDALIVTSKYRSKSKDIHWYGIKHGFFLHLYIAGNIDSLFLKDLYNTAGEMRRGLVFTLWSLPINNGRLWKKHQTGKKKKAKNMKIYEYEWPSHHITEVVHNSLAKNFTKMFNKKVSQKS